MFDNPSLVFLSVFYGGKKKKKRKEIKISYKVKEDPVAVGTMKYRLGNSERVFLF